MTKRQTGFVGISAALLLATTASAGDAGKGEAAFKSQCAICHTAQKGAMNRIGPNLYGVAGRKAGSVPGYLYSAPVKQAGFAWDTTHLDAYLAAPKQYVPGNKMAYLGEKDPERRGDIVAYLVSLH